MKKILSFLLVIAVAVSLIACNLENTETTAQTEAETKEPLGLVTDHESFEREVSKRIDLSSYDVTVEESFSTNITSEYRTYTHKENIKLTEQHTPFTVTIEGIAVTMPTAVSTFIDNGFQVTHINGQFVSGGVDTNQTFYSGSLTMKTPGGKSLNIYAIAADLTAPTKMKNCLVIQIAPKLYEGERYYPDSKVPTVPEIVYFNGITNDATLDDILSKLGQPQKITHSFSKSNERTNLLQLQLAYYFENTEYSGSMHFTMDIFRLPDGSRANMAHDISYYINPPRE